MEKTLNQLNNIKARIWQDNSHEVSIIYYPRLNRFVAKCDAIMTEKRITLNTAERVLNDMFYDYCVEKASWMGVS